MTDLLKKVPDPRRVDDGPCKYGPIGESGSSSGKSCRWYCIWTTEVDLVRIYGPHASMLGVEQNAEAGA